MNESINKMSILLRKFCSIFNKNFISSCLLRNHSNMLLRSSSTERVAGTAMIMQYLSLDSIAVVAKIEQCLIEDYYFKLALFIQTI
jgi:hypothetical protein